MRYEIRRGQLDHPRVADLLRAHLHALARLTPADSMHALDIGRLQGPDITFWSAWDGDDAVGCAALRQINATHGEVKSMRTSAPYLRRGVASRLLDHVIDEATSRGYRHLSLETGTAPAFEPAHRLYARAGFASCGPFDSYVADPHSVFMTRVL